MATIFDTLESALQGNGLSGALTAVTGPLGDVSSLISGSSSNPPSAVSGVGSALRGLPLPNIDIASAFTSSFSSLQTALPSNTSSITGGLTSGLDQLKSSSSDLTSQLGEALKVVQAFYQLTELDFTGQNPPPAPNPGGGAPAPGGGAGPAAGGGGAGAGAGNPPAPPVTAQSMDQVHTALAGLPSPFTIDSFLTWIHGVLDSATLDDFGIQQIPIFTDLRDYLGTLLAWKAGDANAIHTQLAATLAQLDAYLKTPLDAAFTPVASAATALAAKLHAAELTQVADDIAARLTDLKAPVTSGSLSGAGATITALTTVLDQYDALKAALTTDLATLPAFQQQLVALPTDLDAEMGRIVSALRPGHSLALFDHITAGVQSANTAIQKPINDLRLFLSRLAAWLEDFLNKINFKAVTQPLADAANAMKSVVDGLDNTVVAVTMQIQQIFSKIESVLNLLDPAQLTTAAQSAIDSFKADIVGKVSGLLQPALDAVQQVVHTISQGVQAFDPKQLEAVINDAFQKIAGVLSDPRIGEVRTDLDNVAQQLEAFSFSPVTSEVVKDLGVIADTLKGLGDLPSPLDDALHTALSVLPADLKPILDPIVDEFGEIVNAGPVKVLDTVADLPKQIADKIRAFDPSTMLGDGLSGPYNKLVADMEGFKPSSLLDSVKTELDSLKDRLKQNINPANALQGLDAPFQDLSKALDNFHPETIVAELNTKLHDVLSSVTATVPSTDIFDQVAAAIQRVKDAIDTANSVTTAFDKVRTILQGLADPQTQLDAWLAPILAKIDGLGDTAAMQASLASISTSVDGMTLAGVTAKLTTAVTPVTAALNTLNPLAKWTTVIQAVRALSNVDALPASAQKNQLKAALARLDPALPATGAPYQTLAALSQSIAKAQSDFAAISDWDARYTADDAVLGGLHGLTATAENVKQWIHDAVSDELIKPLAGIFSLASPAFGIIDALTSEFQKLMTDLQTKVDELMQGVDALTSIQTSMQALLDRIKNFNLDFLTTSLKSLFDNLRAKLDAINPANLAKALDAIFNGVLDSLSIDLFLPPADVAKIDTDYAALVDTLKSLDPSTILTTIVQDVFNKDVLPLLDKIDMSEPLHRIADRLASLTDELKTELDKVEDAFNDMVHSVPAGAAA